MNDSQCRVAIHVDGTQTTRTVDLALPKRVRLGDMLPSILNLVLDHPEAWTGERWRLRRIGGVPLDELFTLQDNEVRDGELLWLTTDDAPTPIFVDADAARTVVASRPAGGVPQQVCVGASLAAACVGAGAVMCSARSAVGTAPFLTAAGLTGAAVMAAIVAKSRCPQTLLGATLSTMAVIMAAVTGAVAVPAGPLAAHLLLASAATLAVTALLLRLGGGITPLTAVSAAAPLCAVASAVAVAWNLAAATAGALLAALALAALSAAPRVAVQVTRIGPAPPDVAGSEAPSGVEPSRASHAHDTLTGVVIGASAAAVLGIALVACGARSPGQSLVATVAFTIVVGTALLLRVRTHIGTLRRSALAVCGFVGVAAGLVAMALAVPQRAHLFGILSCLLATGALIPLLDVTPSLAVRRVAELAEYVALAAVVPLGCWLAGVFDLVRGLALT